MATDTMGSVTAHPDQALLEIARKHLEEGCPLAQTFDQDEASYRGALTRLGWLATQLGRSVTPMPPCGSFIVTEVEWIHETGDVVVLFDCAEAPFQSPSLVAQRLSAGFVERLEVGDILRAKKRKPRARVARKPRTKR